MQDDAALLRDYADSRSEAAFAEIVRRYLDLVYSAARRQVGGDAHLAEDVVQSVFRDLAQKARAVANVSVLAGWLHTSTHYAAAKIVRGERRRRVREAQAHAMQEFLNESARDAEWARIRPVLDDTLRQLRPGDRDAILLRFFGGEAFVNIGARLSVTENAARMRVERALEKLRGLLEQRGIHSTSAALATVLAGQAVTAAPAALATSVTHAALVGVASGGAAVSFFQFMAITKTQVVVAGALLIGGGTIVVQQQQAELRLEKEIELLRAQNSELARTQDQNRKLASDTTLAEAFRGEAQNLSSLRAQAESLRQKEQALAADLRRRGEAKAAARLALNSAKNREPATETTTVKQGDHMPVLKSHVAPAYPAALRQAGISGEAIVKVVVDDKGDVQSAVVIRSTHRELEAAALEAVKQWKFEPGVKGGRNVNTSTQIPIVFNIEPDEENWF